MNHSFASRIRTVCQYCCLSLPATLALSTFAGVATIPSAEKLLPDDTLMMVTMPDFAKVRDLYKMSPQLQLWNDPAMKPFKDKFMSKMNEELLRPLERELGVSFDDYANLPQGQVTIALTQNGWTGTAEQPAGLLLLMDVKDKSSQLKTNLAALRKQWVDAGKALKTEKVRDIEFLVFPMSHKDVPASLKKILNSSASNEADSSDAETNKSAKSELVIGQFESLLIVGNSLKPVEKVVVHLTGGSMPTLGDLASYEANRLSLFRDAPLYGWINVKGLMDVFNHRAATKSADEEDPFALFNPEKLLAAAGFNGVKTFAFKVQISNEGSLVQFFVGVPEASRQGLFKLYPGEAKESAPPPFVPADVVKFQRWRLDGQKAWATIEKVLGDISPQILTSLNFLFEQASLAAKEKDPGYNVKKSFVGNLGDDMITYEKTPRSTAAADVDTPPALMLIGSPHPDQLAAAMRSILALLSQQGGAPTEREFLGRKIYSLPTPSLPLPTATPARRSTLSYAASGSYLALSTDATILEEYLRSSDGPQKSLRDTPGLVDAAAKLGGSGTGFFGYENRVETARVWFESLKTNPSAATNANAAPGIPAWNPESGFGIKDWADYSLLPPFEKISKYFHFTVYVGSASVDGLNYKLYSPAPPALKK